MADRERENCNQLPIETERKRLPFDSESLATEIKVLEKELNTKQIKFCQQMAALPKSHKQAAIAAGYSEISAGSRASQMLGNETIVRLIACLRRADELRNGLPASFKRGWLVKMISDTKTRNSDRNSSLKLLAELDGDLQSQGAAATIINVSLPFASPTPVPFTQSDDTESDDIEDAEIIEYPSMGFLDSNKGGEGR